MKYYVLIIISLTVFQIAIGQTDACCVYVDHTGNNIASEIQKVDQASCELKQAIGPHYEDFGSKFKVYTSSSYRYTNDFENGGSNYLNSLLGIDVNTDYYLILSKVFDEVGNYLSTDIELKLPIDGMFRCHDEQANDRITLGINNIVNQAESMIDFADFEVAAINYLKTYLDKHTKYSDPNIECTACMTEIELNDFVSNLGIDFIPLDNVSIGTSDPAQFSSDDNFVNLTTINEMVFENGFAQELDINSVMTNYMDSIEDLEGISTTGILFSWENLCDDQSLQDKIDEINESHFGFIIVVTRSEVDDSPTLDNPDDSESKMLDSYNYFYTMIFNENHTERISFGGYNPVDLFNSKLTINSSVNSNSTSITCLPSVVGDISLTVNLGIENNTSHHINSPTAFGYNIALDLQAESYIGGGLAAGITWLVFPTGDYDWYPYKYAFHEAYSTLGNGWGISANASGELTFGFNASNVSVDPSQLGGTYQVLLMANGGGNISPVLELGGTF